MNHHRVRTGKANSIRRTAHDSDMEQQQVHTASKPDVLQLQRLIGNQAVGKMLQRNDLPEPAEGSTRVNPRRMSYKDFDGKQYRVSGREPDRKIEEVQRTETPEGDVVYMAMGLVVGFQGNKPVVDYYETPVDLGDWYPRVTHVNGMNVKPQSGIQDALSLQAGINEQLAKGGDDVALGQDAVDVLYTYSTTLSFIPDVFDCLVGKMGFDDTVVDMQKQVMLDAVHNKQRVSVSAHSRGTIKTDNAVRESFATLTEEMIPVIEQELSGTITMTERNRSRLQSAIRDIAKARAKEEMDNYIHLIYAGNAVEFPSSVLPIDFIVGSRDAISILFGTYTETGTQDHALVPGGHDDSTMTKLPGHGHGYQGYAPTAAEIIGQDIIRERD